MFQDQQRIPFINPLLDTFLKTKCIFENVLCIIYSIPTVFILYTVGMNGVVLGNESDLTCFVFSVVTAVCSPVHIGQRQMLIQNISNMHH